MYVTVQRPALHLLVVVGGKCVQYELARAVRADVVAHVVSLGQHVGAHLVEGGGRNHVALPVDLPGYRRIHGTKLVVTTVTSGGSSVFCNIDCVSGPAIHEVWGVVVFVVYDGEDLGLNTNGGGDILGLESQESLHVQVAKDTVVERSLELVYGTAGSGGRIRPMNLVSLADLHVLAVFPVEWLGKLFIM